MSTFNRQTCDHESVLYLGIHAFVNFYKIKQLRYNRGLNKASFVYFKNKP